MSKLEQELDIFINMKPKKSRKVKLVLEDKGAEIEGLSERILDLMKQRDALKTKLDKVRALIEKHIQDVPPEFVKVVDKHFWDLI